MENENKNGITNQTNQTPNDGAGRTGGTAENYLNDLNELKKTTVPKADYEKLQLENDQLREAVRTGFAASLKEDETNVVVTKSDEEINQMIRNLYGDPDKQISNLDYAQQALDLRQARIDRGEPDPFVPMSSQYTPTQYDYETANNVAETLKECIKVADGNSEVFTAELMRRTQNVRIR